MPAPEARRLKEGDGDAAGAMRAGSYEPVMIDRGLSIACSVSRTCIGCLCFSNGHKLKTLRPVLTKNFNRMI
jgi:hypothetical protein